MDTKVYDSRVFPHRELTDKIIGVFYETYNELGFGFLESVYHRALMIALEDAGLGVESQVNLPVFFRGAQVGDFYADLLVNRVILLELKAAAEVDGSHESQLLNYLKASSFELGLILNFGPKPRIRRLAFSNDRKRSRPPILVD